MTLLRAGVLAATAGLVLAATPTNAAADPAGTTTGGSGAAEVSCDYSFAQWRGGFSADVTIRNNGPTITGWRVDLRFDTASTLGVAWSADMSQPDAYAMSAQNVSWNRVILPGRAVTFGWVAIASEHEVPDLAVNGVPCEIRAPAQ